MATLRSPIPKVEEVDAIDIEIAKLREEQARKRELEGYLKDARRIHDVYQSYIEAGFTAEQAWEMITIVLKK